MTFTLGTPQVVWICVVAFDIAYAAVNHGRPQGPYNVWATIAGSALGIALLWWGGFF